MDKIGHQVRLLRTTGFNNFKPVYRLKYPPCPPRAAFIFIIISLLLLLFFLERTMGMNSYEVDGPKAGSSKKACSNFILPAITVCGIIMAIILLSVFFTRPKGSAASAPSQFQGSYTFTPANASGAYGPTLAAIIANATAAERAWVSAYVGMTTPGIQDWTVPATGLYKFEIAGAQGGAPTIGIGRFGLGAKITIQTTLTMGSIVRILVGQMGQSDNYQGNGGGGTYMFYNLNDTYPIAVAGGGAGGSSDGSVYHNTSFLDGTVNTDFLPTPSYDANGNVIVLNGSNVPGKGGLTTNATSYTAGAGGGWLSDGQSPGLASCSYAVTGGRSPRNGGIGGMGGSGSLVSQGGFGGGGGATGACFSSASGAGGGYTGGNAGTNGCCNNEAAGGSSYWSPSVTLLSAMAGYNMGDGYVTVTKMF